MTTPERTLIRTDITLALANADHIFDYHGWDLRWSGWRTPYNQFIEIGFWIAYSWTTKRILYCTTFGNVGELEHELSPIPYTVTEEIRKQYPNLFILTRIDKSKMARDAAEQLLDMIDQGR